MKRQCVLCFRDDAMDYEWAADRIEKFMCGKDLKKIGLCAYCDAGIEAEMGEVLLGHKNLTERRQRIGEIQQFRKEMPDEMAQTFALEALRKNLYWKSKSTHKGSFYSRFDREHGRRAIYPGEKRPTKTVSEK